MHLRFKITDMRAKYKREFKTSMEKAYAFKDGAVFYYGRNDYPHATFMLHQFIELTLTAIEVLFIRKPFRTHHIQLHLKYISEQIPLVELGFPTIAEDEIRLVSLLDKSYIAVRYKSLYVIEKEQIDTFLRWVNNLEQRITDIYESDFGIDEALN